MKFFLVLTLICLALAARADEQMATLKVGSDVYTHVTITSVTATDVYFTSDQGMANAKLKNLDPALQEHFKFDPTKVAAAETEATQQNAALKSAHDANSSNPAIDKANANSIRDDAINRVREIVNQPVPQIPIARNEPDLDYYPNGWFHPGAEKPDFDTVDVRTTQDLRYARKKYSTSNLNPGVGFLGADIEFNSATKYFYEDRSLPKKKLSEAEMLEINRLYRIIGKCDDLLDPAKNPSLTQAPMKYFSLHRSMIIGIALGVVVLLLGIRALSGGRTA